MDATEADVPYAYTDRPDYRVDILPRRNLVRATLDGEVLAESRTCLLVDEQDHGIVFYFPRDDVQLDRLEASDHTSTCPWKGRASYWARPGAPEDWLAWTYEAPHTEVARLTGYVAFYQDKVDVTVGVATPSYSGR